jgi:hypothetical protein
MLVLSTNHIPWRTSRALDESTNHGDIEGTGDMPSTIKWASYGWMVWADIGFKDMKSSDAHPELLRVIEFAIERGCQWIRFDCDGPEIPELLTFDQHAEESTKRHSFISKRGTSPVESVSLPLDAKKAQRPFVTWSCPKCGGKSHRCKTGGPGCRHCDNEACGHGWRQ